jgi:dipeptidyl aminopeptidase/acylaminoacyl peptidase
MRRRARSCGRPAAPTKKEPHLYRCAVSIAGVSDLSQVARDDEWSYGGRDAVREATGTDKAQLAAQSPVLHADQIKIPVLLVHGDQDSTVLLSQSEAMAKELKQHGVPSELVVVKGGEHGLLRPQMRLTLYTKLEAFPRDKPGLAVTCSPIAQNHVRGNPDTVFFSVQPF